MRVFFQAHHGGIRQRCLVQVVQSVDDTHDLGIHVSMMVGVGLMKQHTGIKFQSIFRSRRLFVASSSSITCPGCDMKIFNASSPSPACCRIFLSTLPFRMASARGAGSSFPASKGAVDFSVSDIVP